MARYDDDDDDDYEEEDVRPQKKRFKKKGSGSNSNVLLIVIVCLVGVLVVCGGIGTALLLPALLPAVQQAREAARRSQSKNNLKQIGLAMHNYHDVYNTFPPRGIVREDGTEMLSWQASILPYVDQVGIYNQINAEAGWNSPENKPVFSQPVVTYLNPAILTNPGEAVSHYAGNSQVLQINKGFSLRQMTDGSSNILLVGEVATGFKPWADPSNVRDPALGIGKTAEQFGGPYRGGVHFLLADGSVRFVSENVDMETLKRLANPADGQVVGEF